MTGWQSECTPSAPSVNQEAMELTRTVSHLAAANQQLAGAHSALLAQLERLYLELNKEREARLLLQDYRSRCEGEENLKHRIEAIENAVEGRNSTLSPRYRSDDNRGHRNFLHNNPRRGEAENLRREYQKAVERIQKLESELEPPRENENLEQTVEDTRWPIKIENRDPEREDRVPSLLGELSRLKNNYLETQDVNRRLTNEVEKQKKIIEKLRRDYEVIK